MTYDLANTDKLNVFRQELQRQNIQLLPPDINKSYPTFSVERTKDGTLAVRYALAAVKNVGLGAIQTMVRARDEGGPFRSLADFCERVDPEDPEQAAAGKPGAGRRLRFHPSEPQAGLSRRWSRCCARRWRSPRRKHQQPEQPVRRCGQGGRDAGRRT